MKKFYKFYFLFLSVNLFSQDYDQIEKKVVQLVVQNNRTIEINKLKESSAHKDVQLAKSNWGDVLVGQYNLNEANINPSSTNGMNIYYPKYLVGLRVSLSTFLKNPITVKKSKIEEEIVQHTSEMETIALEHEVKRRYRLYVAKKENLFLRKQLVEETKSQLNITTKKYNNKEITYEEYAKLNLNYISLKETLNISESEMYVAKYNLEELIGVDIDSIK